MNNDYEQHKLRLSASYNGSPIWFSLGADLQHPDAAELDIPSDLAEQITRWNVIFSLLLDWDDPGTDKATSSERELFELCGHSLAQRLANALKRDVEYGGEPRITFSPGAP